MNKIEKYKSLFFTLATILLILIFLTSLIENTYILVFFGSLMIILEYQLVVLMIKLIKVSKNVKNEDINKEEFYDSDR